MIPQDQESGRYFSMAGTYLKETLDVCIELSEFCPKLNGPMAYIEAPIFPSCSHGPHQRPTPARTLALRFVQAHVLLSSLYFPPLKPLLGRLWARTSRNAPVVPPSLLQPLLCGELQLSIQVWTGLFAVDEVAKAATDASFAAVKPATGFAEIGHGRELAVDGSCRVPP